MKEAKASIIQGMNSPNPEIVNDTANNYPAL